MPFSSYFKSVLNSISLYLNYKPGMEIKWSCVQWWHWLWLMLAVKSVVFPCADVSVEVKAQYVERCSIQWLHSAQPLQQNSIQVSGVIESPSYLCIDVCKCICMYVCIYICMYVCMYWAGQQVESVVKVSPSGQNDSYTGGDVSGWPTVSWKSVVPFWVEMSRESSVTV